MESGEQYSLGIQVAEFGSIVQAKGKHWIPGHYFLGTLVERVSSKCCQCHTICITGNQGDSGQER